MSLLLLPASRLRSQSGRARAEEEERGGFGDRRWIHDDVIELVRAELTCALAPVDTCEVREIGENKRLEPEACRRKGLADRSSPELKPRKVNRW